uniref:Small ribosomal subunit protein uS3c n=1 Tax=Picocystis salinarum TaxID=88271 RepID=A0A088CK48_9CHLO|nr:ribosomal protein S3 [Picocystis salinarum]AID67647.1 ribosomal protein S3 [Picocystis salinarum]|mmetsp:Transcript_4561/g.28921  ORF Transcript_4561/g.28921 Transcript_4561/m.28921 type:complete len:213 (+) Transcript_4561:149-787(+)
MGQKIHPVGLRIGITQEHKSQWFAKKYNYSKLLQEDAIIREYFKTRFHKSGISQIKIQRKISRINVEIHTAKSRIFVTKGLDEIRKELEKELPLNREIRIQITEIEDANKYATLVAENIVEQLEKRVAFRRAIKQAMRKAQRSGVLGIKIQVSGRLNGAEIARSEWAREGRVPLQTLRVDVDYSSQTAKTIYGILGVKVWVVQSKNSNKGVK